MVTISYDYNNIPI